MSILISVIILILVLLVQILMQLPSGVFAIFYHYALGKKSKRKADTLSLYFILGSEFFIATIFLILCIFIFTFNKFFDFNLSYILWILAGIFLAETIISLFFYYRKGKTTELFISRRSAKCFQKHSEKVKTRTDSFVLGFFSYIPELIFTLPLYIITIIILMNFTILPRAIIILLFIVLSILPIVITHILFLTGHNLADIARLRLKLKPCIKAMLALSFVFLVIILIGALING